MVAPILTYLSATYSTTLAVPMLIFTCGGLISFVLAVYSGPETKGTVMVADLGRSRRPETTSRWADTPKRAGGIPGLLAVEWRG
jgi:hypothetical protein